MPWGKYSKTQNFSSSNRTKKTKIDIDGNEGVETIS